MQKNNINSIFIRTRNHRNHRKLINKIIDFFEHITYSLKYHQTILIDTLFVK